MAQWEKSFSKWSLGSHIATAVNTTNPCSNEVEMPEKIAIPVPHIISFADLMTRCSLFDGFFPVPKTQQESEDTYHWLREVYIESFQSDYPEVLSPSVCGSGNNNQIRVMNGLLHVYIDSGK